MDMLAIIGGVILAFIIYWPSYRNEERRRKADATMARYAKRFGP